METCGVHPLKFGRKRKPYMCLLFIHAATSVDRPDLPDHYGTHTVDLRHSSLFLFPPTNYPVHRKLKKAHRKVDVMPLHVTILKNTNVMADQRKDCEPTHTPYSKGEGHSATRARATYL